MTIDDPRPARWAVCRLCGLVGPPAWPTVARWTTCPTCATWRHQWPAADPRRDLAVADLLDLPDPWPGLGLEAGFLWWWEDRTALVAFTRFAYVDLDDLRRRAALVLPADVLDLDAVVRS